MLLQVRFEGHVQEFGWLIPVPGLPRIEKGTMEAFYELSELTQRQFGGNHDGSLKMGTASAGVAQPVKVIETKTVGAYEVAVLAAKDSGSLAQWLKAHDFSIPNEKSGIVDGYIRKGWYFVAVKIALNKGVGLTMAPPATKKKSGNPPRMQAVQKKLASGELHPLLISFDTALCVFPLKISAVSGKPSEVSLYVLSEKPLLNRFLLDEACQKLDRDYAEWARKKQDNDKARQICEQNLRVMSLASQLYSAENPGGTGRQPARQRKWTVEDLQAMAAESAPPAQQRSLGGEFYFYDKELLHCLRAGSNQLTKAAKTLPRLRNHNWYVTKYTRTFLPAEMHDLEFQPAVPALEKVLSRPSGRSAAVQLAHFAPSGTPALLRACKSKNPTERINAVTGLERCRDQAIVEPLVGFLKDENPRIRLHAARAAANNWNPRLMDPMVALLGDPYREIREEACQCLCTHDKKERTPAYLALLKHRDRNVRVCSLGILLHLNPDAIPPAILIQMLRLNDPELQSITLHTIWKLDRDIVPRSDLLPLLTSTRADNIYVATKLIEGNGLVQPELPEPRAKIREAEERKRWLTSLETAALVTNRLSEARLFALKFLGRNPDAKAVELILTLLRDPNPVVSSRAFSVLKSITGQNLSESDPGEWEKWWSEHKRSYKTGVTRNGPVMH